MTSGPPDQACLRRRSGQATRGETCDTMHRMLVEQRFWNDGGWEGLALEPILADWAAGHSTPMRVYVLIVVLGFAALGGPVVSAAIQPASTSRYAEDRAVEAGGGGRGIGGPYAVTDTVGQPVVGESSSSSCALANGFWNRVIIEPPGGWANRPPTTQPFVIFRQPGASLRIRIADLAAFWSDPDGHAVEWVGAESASTNGVTIFTSAACILYDPGIDPQRNVRDEFAYTLRDVPPACMASEMAAGIIVVLVEGDSGRSFNIVSARLAPDGNSTITFAGIPGQSYIVQRTLLLDSPIVWTTLTNHVDGGTQFLAGSNGLWIHTDLDSTNHPTRFYRSAVPITPKGINP